MNNTRRSVLSARTLALTGAAALGLAVLAGCGGDGASTTTSPTAAATTAAPASATAAPVTLADSWVKAAPSGMTGVFGVLQNNTGAEVIIVGGSSPVAGKVEMHEVAMIDGAMKMREKTEGFVIPANGSHELKPGADHVMLMDLNGPVTAGQSVEVTLQTKDGASFTTSVLAKEFAGANESYAPGQGGSMSTSPSAGASS